MMARLETVDPRLRIIDVEVGMRGMAALVTFASTLDGIVPLNDPAIRTQPC